MIFSLRLFLVTFLIVLQFIAPLVHAHTGEKILSQGLHIPGLEVYAQSISQDTLSATPAVNDFCKVATFCNNSDGQVVGIGTGFSRDFAIPIQKFYKIIADTHHSYYLPSQTFVFDAISLVFSTPSIQVIPLLGQLASIAHSPRAPPIHA